MIFTSVIIFRTVTMYVMLVIIMRLMGKRQIGEMQLSELVVTLMLSEIAAIPIVEEEYSLFDAIIPIILLVVLEITISFFVTKSARLKRIIDGRPSVVIKDGKIRMEELRRLRITLDELLSEMRQKDIFDVRDVEYALIENNGKLSVCLKNNVRAASVEDLGIESARSGLAYTLVVDGEICTSGLFLLEMNENQVLRELKKKKIPLKNVLLMTIDEDGEISITKKPKDIS